MGKARAKIGKDDTSQSRHGAVDDCSTNVRGALHSKKIGNISRALSHPLSFQRTQARNPENLHEKQKTLFQKETQQETAHQGLQ